MNYTHNRQGHTLIELMVVICLLMMLTRLVQGNLSFMDGAIARAELHKIYGVCTYLQILAQATGQPQVLAFDVPNHAYSYNGVTERLPSGVRFGVIEGVKGPPSLPTHTITVPITSENQCITFTPHGIIQPGTVYLKTADNMRMYALSCAVAQASFLRMYQYRGVWRALT